MSAESPGLNVVGPAAPRRLAPPVPTEPPGVRPPGPRRLRGDGRPTPEPLILTRVLLLAARRAGFDFDTAWDIATSAALSYRSDRDAAGWWDVLASTRDAWAEAYAGERSDLAALL